jgi:hypothetical protein
MKHIHFIFLFLVLTTVACFEPDQTIIKEEHLALGNPAPTTRDFKAINAQHKVLVAMFDDGVDYNHPQLEQNIHFDLDVNGAPKGLGIDFLAKDNWSSYRVVSTDRYYFKDLSKDRQAEILKSNTAELYDKALVRSYAQKDCIVNSLIDMEPKYAKYLNPYRHLTESINTHGTHMAGRCDSADEAGRLA